MNTSTHSPRFRAADEKDIPILLGFINEFYKTEHIPFNAPIIEESLKHLFSNSSFGRLWIIYPDDTPAGYILVTFGFSLEYHGIAALVDEFYIREQFRGKGTGKAALKYVEQQLNESGIKTMHLEVDRNNVYAKELYHKCGFLDHDRYLLTKWL